MHDRHREASSLIKDAVDIINSNTEIDEDGDYDFEMAKQGLREFSQ